jgi:hypothetical protein
MKATIDEIMWLCFDKWPETSKTKVNRQGFRDYLESFLHLQPSAEEQLKMIIELSQEEDRLVIMRGVMNILEHNYPATHNKIVEREKYYRIREQLKI